MTLELSQSQTWSAGVGRAGIRLVVRSGEVWITREGDSNDHVLTAAQGMESRRRGKLVVMALSPARVEVTALAAPVVHEGRYAHAATR
jgi:hypothetical protein